MTRNRDIERVLDRFYAEGPAEVPDRLLLGVFDQIERLPQRRLAKQMTRFATMNSNFRVAAAAVLVVAVIGVGAFAISQKPDIGSQSTPAPSPTAAQTSGVTISTLPAAFRYKWIGALRPVAQVVPAITCSRMLMGDGLLQYNGCGPDPVLASTAGVSDPNIIVFKLISKESGCLAGDVGTYAYTLSPNGKSLALTRVEEACDARAEAVSGAWNRSDCPNAGSPCLGDLDAGRYVSANFNPFVPRTEWVATDAALSYTVPAGWANIEDCDNCYALAKQGAPENEAIYLFSDVAAHVQDEKCTNDLAPGIGQTARAISTWLTTLPGLVTTTPIPTTIGGLSGFAVDVSLARSWSQTCPYSDGEPVVPLFTDPLKGGFDWNVGGAGHSREILLDLPGGRVLLIDLGAANKAAFDALMQDAMPVVGTFVFTP